MKTDTKEDFILKALKIHGSNYDYSKVKYKNQDTKIIIICPQHGEFIQRPDHHLSGRKCKKCSTKSQKNIERYAVAPDEFIKKATKKWGDIYDYSKVEYVSAKYKVIIGCRKHGYFLQSPDSHLKHKCLKCSIEENANKQRKSSGEFIKESETIHGKLFDYTKCVYKGNRVKVEIICAEHGSFFQTPYNHLMGKGCKLCSNKSKKEIVISNLLTDKKICFIREKTFSDCINPKTGKKLLFDFYLPDYNVCIEYDGIQHFKQVEFWGGKSNLIENQFRDSIKEKFCQSHNIQLFRIKYSENLTRKIHSICSNIIS